MKPARDERRGLRFILSFAAIGAGAGTVYDALAPGSLWVDVATGACDGAALSALEIFLRTRRTLLRWPFAAYFALRVALYLAVMLIINGPPASTATGHAPLDWRGVGYAFAISVGANLVFSVNQLLGPGVLFAFAAGRYHRPRRERRVVLYADLTGSTGIAEALGEERFLDLLNAFFDDIAAAIAREGGAIHKYVGDEAIATWPDGVDPACPIRACFDARRRIAARAPWYCARFGAAPAFRAAIHEGPVVLGELGSARKEIALIGDAMNVAARLLEEARDAGAFVLVSGPIYDRLAAPPPGLVAERRGSLTPRGKSVRIEIVSLRET